MKHFTRFLCLFFAAAMLLTMAACGSKNTDTDTKTGSEKKQLVVATSPDFPPFESLDGSDIVGIEPKLMQAIADKLGMELVWEQVDFDSIIPGIQAGRYIDYAWSGIFDKPVDPYAPDAELKPIAGLDRAKYGGVMLQTHTTSWNAQYETQLSAEIKDFCTNCAESSNVFAFWDMPSNLQGIETGPMSAFQRVTKVYTNPAAKYMLVVRNKGWQGSYGTYTKDW